MIAKEIMSLLNNGEYTDIDTTISEEFDSKQFYYDGQWQLMKPDQTPREANDDTALEKFMAELYSLIKEEEIEEELDEEEKGEER